MSVKNSTISYPISQTISEDVSVYDLPEAARILRLHPETVRRYCREGRIDCLNVSTSIRKPLYRITPDAIKKFLKTGGRK